MLASLPHFDLYMWAGNTLLTLVLLTIILLRNQQSRYPLFTLYLCTNLLQTALQVYIYQRYTDIKWNPAYGLIWGSQAVVAVTRALAAAEFCHRVLGEYIGVWALAIRLLTAFGAAIFGLAVYFGRDGMMYAVTTLEVGTEAFILVLVVGLFVFARYYHVRMTRSDLLLGLGLGLISCVKILNDLVLSRFLDRYGTEWNRVGELSYSAVLGVWIAAAFVAEAIRIRAAMARTTDAYRALAPEINSRLWQLNQQLIRLWKLEEPRP